jgi:sugar transferase (PEP-CTERM system associated)
MACIEATILFSSVYVAGIVVLGSFANSQRVLGPLLPKAAVVAVIVLLSLIAMGLYQFNQRLYFRETVVRIVVALGVASLAIAGVFNAFPHIMISRDIASIAVGYALVMILLFRFLFSRRIDQNIFRRRTMIYGAGDRAASLFDLRRKADRRGFKIVGRLAAPGDTIVGDRSDVFMTNGKSIIEYVRDTGADEIVIAMDERRGNFPIRELLDARLQGISVIDLVEFLERETGKIPIELVNPGWLIFSEGFHISRFRRISQRALDIIVCAGLILCTWPIMLFIVLATKIEDGLAAPVLYRQCRVGRGGRRFQLFKFRSMAVNAEADGKAVWADENDARITLVGRFLRKSRLDELPQAFNVLRGDMSLVGPRPERPEFVKTLQAEIPYYAERHTVKPGVTGWAQLRYVYGASQEDAKEKLQYDLYYVKNQSLTLDIMILLQTVEVVLWGKGAR